jgi:transcriptional regulator with XRE-family HTH domain
LAALLIPSVVLGARYFSKDLHILESLLPLSGHRFGYLPDADATISTWPHYVLHRPAIQGSGILAYAVPCSLSAMNTNQRRTHLSALLRSRRALLQPDDVGLPSHRNRRTPGLRRDEVAGLASISVEWYTWLEQGRPIQPSANSIERIADALRFSEVERTYALLLAGFGVSGQTMSVDSSDFRATVQRTLNAFSDAPAIVYNDRFDILSSNAAATAVYGRDVCAGSKWERNMLWRFFMDEDRRRMYPDGERDLGIRNLIHALRLHWAGVEDSQHAEELIDELRHTSGVFDAIWNEQAVSRLAALPGKVRPLGAAFAIDIQYTRFQLLDSPGYVIAAILPTDGQQANLLNRHLSAFG